MHIFLIQELRHCIHKLESPSPQLCVAPWRFRPGRLGTKPPLSPLLAEPSASFTSKDVHDVFALAGSGEVHRRARRVPEHADRVDVRAALDLSEPK